MSSNREKIDYFTAEFNNHCEIVRCAVEKLSLNWWEKLLLIHWG